MMGPVLLSLAPQSVLFGGQARYIHMGRRFRPGGSNISTEDLIALLVVLVAVSAAICLLSRYLAMREKRGHNSPRRLFRELCRIHGIGWSQRQLLRQLARWHRLPHATELFVQPHCFEVQELGPAFANRHGQLTALRERLFGGKDE